jgi:hypothetical protein
VTSKEIQMTPEERAIQIVDLWFKDVEPDDDRSLRIHNQRFPTLKTYVVRAIQEAILQEREACADVAGHLGCSRDVVAAIRKRGQLENFLNSPGPRSRRFSSDAAVSDAEHSRGTGMTL